jgi:diaminopimelate decarboxylase
LTKPGQLKKRPIENKQVVNLGGGGGRPQKERKPQIQKECSQLNEQRKEGKSINTRKERNQLNMDGMEIDGTKKDANK